MSSGGGSFFEQRCTFPIHLHPSRLTNVREGVEEQLNSLLLQFVPELDGVLLAYSDLQLAASPDTNPLQCGYIFQERSYIHFAVTLKALTWRVAVGARLVGVVNAVASDHLAILLHGAFHVTVPLAGALQPKSWTYEAEKDRWIDATQFKGDAAEPAEDADADASGVKEEGDTAAAPGKKLTKKELKKLERRRLRDVMLAATGRGAAAKQAKPAPGIVTRGVHVRFEVSAVQHSAEYFKLTGVVVSHRFVASEPLGLTGGFTPLAPIEAVSVKKNEDEVDPALGEADQPEQSEFDMSVLAAVTGTIPAKSNGHAASTPIRSASNASAGMPATPAAPTSAAPKKAHTAAQQEKYAKKQAKLAARLAAKAAAGDDSAVQPMEVDSDTEHAASTPKKAKVEEAPATTSGTEKKRKKSAAIGDEEGDATAKKKKKVKQES